MNLTRVQYTTIRIRLAGIVGEANILFKDDPRRKDREGGYFYVSDGARDWDHFVPFQIGFVPLTRIEKCRDLSQEQARRLIAHPDHLSSYESRDPNEGMWGHWGGAIRIKGTIFSFGGFSELENEALMLMLARVHYGLDPEVLPLLQRIAALSENSYFERLSAVYA